MNERTKLLLTIGISIALALALCALLYLPMSKIGIWPFMSETSLRAQQAKLAAEASALREKINRDLPQAKAELEKLRPMYETAVLILPQERRPEDLLGAINAKASEAGVTTISLSPGAVTAKGGAAEGRQIAGKKAVAAATHEEWSFKIELLGTYDQIATFINKMENFETAEGKRFFAVSDFSIEADNKGLTEEGRHKCSLSMVTYRYAAAAPAAPAAKQ
ncbi:MAG: type 4a pilus biogenesis protein PilO [Planctomycetota bacterium]|nr:type 4a pilus biogenesis protein PilO [Planctomycetota bacterium]